MPSPSPSQRATYLVLSVLLGALTPLFAGCFSHDQYLVDREPLTALLARPPGAPSVAVPALRIKDHKVVFVRSAALDLSAAALSASASAPAIPVEARGHNAMITAGSVITWIGTAVSLAGTVIVAAGGLDLRLTGGLIALSAEPVMWTGTGLWIGGTMRRPYEVGAGRRDLLYLDGEKPREGVLPSARTATMRFEF